MKLKPTILIFTLLVCSSSLLLNAQEEQPGLPNDLDKMFVPDKNSIFNSEKNDEDGSDYLLVDVKNIIKFNPAMLPRSIAAFYYERRLSEQFSLQGGLGICFNKDRVMGSIADDWAYGSDGNSSVRLALIMQYGLYNEPSLFASIAVKLHWENPHSWNAMPYFEMSTRYYENKLKVSKIGYGTMDGSPIVTVRNVSYTLVYGRQYLTEGKIRTSHDFYVGIGMKTVSFDRFISTEIVSPPYGTLHTKTAERTKIPSALIVAGYVFGIGF